MLPLRWCSRCGEKSAAYPGRTSTSEHITCHAGDTCAAHLGPICSPSMRPLFRSAKRRSCRNGRELLAARNLLAIRIVRRKCCAGRHKRRSAREKHVIDVVGLIRPSRQQAVDAAGDPLQLGLRSTSRTRAASPSSQSTPARSETRTALRSASTARTSCGGPPRAAGIPARS